MLFKNKNLVNYVLSSVYWMDLFTVFVLNKLNKLLKVNNSPPGIINGMGWGCWETT